MTMRLDRYTQRAQEALAGAQEVALSYNQSQVEPEHLLLALLNQPEGVVPEIVQQLGIDPRNLQSQLEADLARRPKAYGSNVQPGMSGQLSRVVAGCLQRSQLDARRLRQHRALSVGAGRSERGRRCSACWRVWASRATASWPR